MSHESLHIIAVENPRGAVEPNKPNLDDGALLPRHPKKKALYLESIRGIAAFVVVLHHLVIAFAPSVFVHPPFAHAKFFIGALTNGYLSVRVFFVLSGFVLSLSFFRTASKSAVTSAALRRYFRLVVPVCVSVMLAWGILRAGFYFNLQAASVMASDNIARTSLVTFAPDSKTGFFAALWAGLAGVFFDNDFALNPVLWTMPVELAGSFLVFAILVLFGTVPNRGIIYLVLAFLLHGYFLDFLCGVAFCDLYVTREKVRRDFGVPLWGGVLMMCGGVVLATGGWAWLAEHTGISLSADVLATLSAGMIVGGGVLSPALQRLLEAKPLVFLGKISFSLYIVHGLVNLSLGCAVYIALRQASLSHVVSATVVFFVCILVSLIAAWGLYCVADVQGIRLGRWVEKRFLADTNRD